MPLVARRPRLTYPTPTSSLSLLNLYAGMLGEQREKIALKINHYQGGVTKLVDNQGRYVPNAVRVGAARQVWKGLSAGIQLGRAWSPAYVNCVRADGEAVVASWNQVRFADLVDQYLYFDDLYDGDQWRYENDGVFGEGITGWRAEIVLQQELAHGLGWTASLGTTVGLNRELESRTAALFGSQGLLPEDELGPTLTPISIAAAPSSASLGATYRSGPAVVGLSWSSVFISGSDRNDWVILGAEAIAVAVEIVQHLTIGGVRVAVVVDEELVARLDCTRMNERVAVVAVAADRDVSAEDLAHVLDEVVVSKAIAVGVDVVLLGDPLVDLTVAVVVGAVADLAGIDCVVAA